MWQIVRPIRNLLWVTFASLAIAACGGGSGGGASGASNGLTISMPSPTVLVGRELRARPSVSNPAGGALTFSISRQPAWLGFSPQTGEITGTPDEPDVGTYENVKIKASDGRRTGSASFSITVVASALGRATVSWVAPTQSDDGTPLTNLAGFRVYYGKSADDLRYGVDFNDPGASSGVIEDLTPGQWHFAATAYNKYGVESDRSNTASKTIS